MTLSDAEPHLLRVHPGQPFPTPVRRHHEQPATPDLRAPLLNEQFLFTIPNHEAGLLRGHIRSKACHSVGKTAEELAPRKEALADRANESWMDRSRPGLVSERNRVDPSTRFARSE